MKKYFSYSLFIIILISFFAPFFLPKANAQEPGCTQLDEYGAEVPCSRVYGDNDQLHTAIPIGAQYAASTPAATTEDTSYHLLQPLPCSGNEKAGCDKNGQFSSFQPSGTAKLAEYLNLMLTLFIGLCAVAAVVMIVVGGIQYSTAELVGGKEEAKNRMLNAIFGLVLALGSYAILYTINPDLLRTDFDVGGASVTSKGEQLAKDLANPKPQENTFVQAPASGPGAHPCANFSGKKVLLLGDSLAGSALSNNVCANKTGAGLKQGIGKAVTKGGGTFTSIALGGSTIGQWLQSGNIHCADAQVKPTGTSVNLHNEFTNALNNHPDIIFISLGTNGSASSTIGQDARKLLNQIPGNTQVIWIGPPQWTEGGDNVNAKTQINDVTKEFTNVKYFDSQDCKKYFSGTTCPKNHGDYGPWSKSVLNYCTKEI